MAPLIFIIVLSVLDVMRINIIISCCRATQFAKDFSGFNISKRGSR